MMTDMARLVSHADRPGALAKRGTPEDADAPSSPSVGWLFKPGDGVSPTEFSAHVPVVGIARSTSRGPLRPDGGASNAVLAKVDETRHFRRLDLVLDLDSVPFASKKDAAVWRGSGTTGQYKRFRGERVHRAGWCRSSPSCHTPTWPAPPSIMAGTLSVTETIAYEISPLPLPSP